MPARNIKRDLWNEEALKAERTRLIRYCFRLTGNRDAAEDLAQETLLEAWKHADRLRDSAVWTSFVYGVARNVCLRWQRREFPRLRHHSAVAFSEENETLFTHSHAITPDTALENLENEEMTALLDAALATLPAKDRELLIERHIMEFPIPEMAARRRMTENALRVRTHRARQNLARTLLSPALRETAQSYGLVASDSADGWQETRIWCPRCGQRRLEARLQDNKIRENSFRSPYFAVRCGDCAENLGLDFTSGHPRLPVNTTLALVRAVTNRCSIVLPDGGAVTLRTAFAGTPRRAFTAVIRSVLRRFRRPASRPVWPGYAAFILSVTAVPAPPAFPPAALLTITRRFSSSGERIPAWR